MVNQHAAHGNGNAHYLPTFMEKYDDLTRIANDAEFSRVKAYVGAMDEYGRNGLGELDYKKLDNPEFVQRAAASIGTRLRNDAKAAFKAGEGLPWYRLDQLANTFAGFTGGALKTLMDRERSDFTLSRLMGLSEELNRPIFQALGPSTWAHVPDTFAAKTTVLGELGLTGKLDPGKIGLDGIVQLMVHYHGNSGVISPKAYQRSPAYLTAANHGGH